MTQLIVLPLSLKSLVDLHPDYVGLPNVEPLETIRFDTSASEHIKTALGINQSQLQQYLMNADEVVMWEETPI